MLSRQLQRLPRLAWKHRHIPRCLSSAASLDSTNTNTTQQVKFTVAEQKRELARAALEQVPTHGWTQDAITAAAMQHPRLSLSMSGLLTPNQLVNWIMDDFNQQLKEDPQKQNWSVYEKMKWRLEQVIPFVQSGQWHQGMARGLSTPWTTRQQLHQFIELVSPPGSTMVYQTALGGIFVATELHMLSDSSQDYQDTWVFLQNRLEGLDARDGGDLPLAATAAVASSLLEGLASLVLPSSAASTITTTVPGANPNDYKPKGTSGK